jgi:transcriptional regulator with XRE-family HTH domain
VAPLATAACIAGVRDPVLTRFGARVRELRLERELSQEAFAAACQLDRTYISGIERGVRNPSLINIARIARALKVPVARLFEAA